MKINWKEWPYWLKGGVIGLVLSIITCYLIKINVPQGDPIPYFLYLGSILSFIIIGILTNWIYSKIKTSWLKCGFIGFLIPLVYLVALLFIMKAEGGYLFDSDSFVGFFVIIVIIYLFFASLVFAGVGSIIGYIYGKIKNRKQEVIQQK